MALQVAVPMSYLHERYFGRPSCPNCGETMMASERPEFSECLSGDEIRHFWACDRCDNQFDTVVKFGATAVDGAPNATAKPGLLTAGTSNLRHAFWRMWSPAVAWLSHRAWVCCRGCPSG